MIFENLIEKFIGKKISEKLDLKEGGMDNTPWYKDKGKLAVIIGVLIVAVQKIPAAFGHPVVIPDWLIQVLTGIGIYSASHDANNA